MNRFFKLKKELKTKSFAEIVYYNLKKREFFLLFFFPHTLIFCLIKLINPFFLIRFGLYERSDRLGHFSADINIYIKNKIFKNDNCIDFISFNKSISNKVLLKAFKKYFINLPYFFIEPFFYLNKFKFLNSEKNFIKFNTNTSRDYSKFRNKIIKYNFSQSERKTKKFLEKFNIDINKDKIVLIFARDEYFLKKTFPNKKTNYHNFRNTNINNLKLTSYYLAKRGYFVFRIGKFPKKKNFF